MSSITVSIVQWMWVICWIICGVFLLSLPLAISEKTRHWVSFTSYVASASVGLALWLWGCILTVTLWGWLPLILGLLVFGVGPFFIAIVGLMVNGMWSFVGDMAIVLAIGLAIGFFHNWLVERT